MWTSHFLWRCRSYSFHRKHKKWMAFNKNNAGIDGQICVRKWKKKQSNSPRRKMKYTPADWQTEIYCCVNFILFTLMRFSTSRALNSKRGRESGMYVTHTIYEYIEPCVCVCVAFQHRLPDSMLFAYAHSLPNALSPYQITNIIPFASVCSRDSSIPVKLMWYFGAR